jgi:hypothetical protein
LDKVPGRGETREEKPGGESRYQDRKEGVDRGRGIRNRICRKIETPE